MNGCTNTSEVTEQEDFYVVEFLMQLFNPGFIMLVLSFLRYIYFLISNNSEEILLDGLPCGFMAFVKRTTAAQEPGSCQCSRAIRILTLHL